MQITTDFKIALPPAEAYALLLDVRRVAVCLPGVEIGEEREDGSYAIRIVVRVGPMRLAYAGDVQIAERHDDDLRAILAGAARETRGQGTASATIEMTVAQAGEGSIVQLVSQTKLTGRAAQMGRAVVQGVAEQMIEDLAACLAQQLETADSDAPATSSGGASRERSMLGTLLRGMLRALRRWRPR